MKLNRVLFGMGSSLEHERARAISEQLTALWRIQAGKPVAVWSDDLDLLKRWFDPVATGARIRRMLSDLRPSDVAIDLDPPVVYPVGDERYLVTPQGRLLLDVLHRALDGRRADDESAVPLEPALVIDRAADLLATYRIWTLHRLDDVAGLLASETATLRPSVAGLMLVLLINRNTSPERALPRPKDPVERAAIDAAIRDPARAWTEAFTGKPAKAAAFDLYRGWAIGEVGRRLGPMLHRGFEDEGIFIEESAAEHALNRLIEDLRKRPPDKRARIPSAWEALVSSYRRGRPRLARLGLAHEQPFVTQELQGRLLGIASGDIATTARADALIDVED